MINEVTEPKLLEQLFAPLINLHFKNELRFNDPAVLQYITDLLAKFCSYKELLLKRAYGNDGTPIFDLGEMLIESDPIYGPAPSFEREREVRKHIGDFTLFFAGMYPESINHFRLRRQRVENFVDWMKAGKESYYIVSRFDQYEHAKVAPTFALLSQKFEDCVYGLNLVKNEIEVMQYPIARHKSHIIV